MFHLLRERGTLARRLLFNRAAASARRIGYGVVATLMGVIALVASAYAYVILSAPLRLPELRYTMERWSGVAVYDAKQCFLGVLPGAREGYGDFSDGHWLPSDEKSLLVNAVPKGFWDVLVALEHRSIGTWRTLPGGIDAASLGRSFIDSARGQRRGASTIPQLVAGSLLKARHGSDTGWMARKIAEITYGAALYEEYWRPAPNNTFPLLAANYLPLVQSTSSGRGGVLYGIGLASRILFGKRPEDLTLAEQALLASAVKAQFLLAPSTDRAGHARAVARLERLKRRAMYGLRKAYGPADEAVAAAMREIANKPLPEAVLCSSLLPLLPDDPPIRFRVLFNPSIRMEYFGGAELPQILTELRGSTDDGFRRMIESIALNIDIAKNMRFKKSVTISFADIDSHIIDGPLSFVHRARPEQQIADVLIAAADGAGRVRYFFQLPERPLFDTPRTTGSVSKILGAFALAKNGLANRAYCNRRIDGFLTNANGNAGVSKCSSPVDFYSTREIFARSLNLPMAEALRLVDEHTLEDLIRNTDVQPFHNMPTRTALAFGMARATPAQLLRLMTAAGRGASGAPALAFLPRVIASITWRASGKTQTEELQMLDLARYIPSDAQAQSLKMMLSAPLQPGGTASSLNQCQSEFHWTLAKTGTVSRGERISAKLLLAQGEVSGERLSFVAIASAPDMFGDIKGLVTAKNLSKILCTALSGLESLS